MKALVITQSFVTEPEPQEPKRLPEQSLTLCQDARTREMKRVFAKRSAFKRKCAFSRDNALFRFSRFLSLKCASMRKSSDDKRENAAIFQEITRKNAHVTDKTRLSQNASVKSAAPSPSRVRCCHNVRVCGVRVCLCVNACLYVCVRVCAVGVSMADHVSGSKVSTVHPT